MRRLVGALALVGAVLLLSSLGPAARAATPATPRLPALHAVDDPVHGGRIVDAQGRQVLMRGINVNSLGEYWQGTSFATVFPVMNGDPQTMQGLGFNTVRLVLSWSKVEPARGVYDDAYLAQAAALITRFAKAGMYTVVDMHQDAWGATLAARFGEQCQAPALPALGWDGAPAWATLVPDDVPRCYTGTRERNPAVMRAWSAFFDDEQGIEDAYVAMWGHVARYFAQSTPVAGFDVMNEPNAFAAQSSDLTTMYSKALSAIRQNEQAAGGFSHLVFIEPSVITSSGATRGVPARFSTDPNLVFSPHLYDGAFNNGKIDEASFQHAVADARGLGGLPVVSGEWGTDAIRAGRAYDYFLAHEAFQDRYRIGALYWQWRQSCGDPHQQSNVRLGKTFVVKGLYAVDCATNQITGPRLPLMADLRRGWVRAAPGRLTGLVWNPTAQRLGATGTGAKKNGSPLLAFYPAAPRVHASGLRNVRVLAGRFGTSYIEARPKGGRWKLQIEPAAPTAVATARRKWRQAVTEGFAAQTRKAARKHRSRARP